MSLAVPIPVSINEASPSQPPAELVTTLERIGLADVLEGFIDPARVRRWNFLEVERFAAQHGYRFEREEGNVYGKLMLVPATAQTPPKFRVITRSDHAAVHGSRAR